MKKFLYLPLIPVFVALVLPVSTSAATQTKILRPTSAEVGAVAVYTDSSTNPGLIIGGGIISPDNALVEDSQIVTLDPSLPGPGQSGSSSSLLMVDYEKNLICAEASIQDINAHVLWKEEPLSSQDDDYALLVGTVVSNSTRVLKANYNTESGEVTALTSIYGGISHGGYAGISSTHSGNAPLTLTAEQAPVQSLPSVSALNDQDTRIAIALGDQADNQTDTVGSVDYAYLEVIYDDSNCSPEGIGSSGIKAPKTGSVITIVIIGAAIAAAILGSLFGVKRTKLKHRVSERE